MEICQRRGRIVHLLAGIVHLRNAGVYAVEALSQEKFECANRFTFAAGSARNVAPLLGCDSFTVLLYVVANFFHDLLAWVRRSQWRAAVCFASFAQS
jgi:hypothetical protein